MSRWRGRKMTILRTPVCCPRWITSGVEELLKEITTPPLFASHFPPTAVTTENPRTVKENFFLRQERTLYIDVTNTAVKSITTAVVNGHDHGESKPLSLLPPGRLLLWPMCWKQSNKKFCSDLEANGSGSVKPVRALRADLSWLWPFYNLSLHKVEVEDKKKEKKS